MAATEILDRVETGRFGLGKLDFLVIDFWLRDIDFVD